MPPKKKNPSYFKAKPRDTVDPTVDDSELINATNPVETMTDSLTTDDHSNMNNETVDFRPMRASKTAAVQSTVKIASLNTRVDQLASTVSELKSELATCKEKLHASQKVSSKLRKACSYGGNINRINSYPVRAIRSGFEATNTGRRRARVYATDISKFLQAQFPSDNKAAVDALGNVLARVEFRDSLRAALKVCTPIRKEIQQEVVDGVEKHWTAELGLALRLRLHLSERKYQYLVNHLSCVYDEEEDKYVRVDVGSVKMPSFRTYGSKAKTKSLMQEYFDNLDPQTLEEDEKTISISLHKVLQEHLLKYPLPADTHELKIKLDGDGAPVMPRVSQTCVAIKVIRYFEDMGISEEDWVGLNSPFSSSSLLLFDGKEDYDGIRKHTKRLREDLTDLQTNGLQVGNRRLTVKVVAGGDLKWLNAVCGLSTCSHNYPCVWCLVCQGELHLTWAALTYVRRTRTGMLEHAHLPHDNMVFPWTCSCCAQVYADAEELQTDVHEPTTKTARLKYQTDHFGVGWHKVNLWGLGPEDLVADLLHHDLREIVFILDRTCKPYLLTPARTEGYCQFLKEHVGCFIKVKHESKKQGAKKIKTPNLIGRECKGMLTVYEPLMEFVHGKGTELFHLTVSVWTTYKALRVELFTRLGKGHTMVDRARKAHRIKQLSGRYIEAKLTLGSVADGTQYSHIAHWHFPDMLMKHGDLVDMSTEALEHLHWLRKKDYRDLSNKSKGAMKQLLRTEVARTKVSGIVKSRSKSGHQQRKRAQRGG